jgi:hypothetical protein
VQSALSLSEQENSPLNLSFLPSFQPKSNNFAYLFKTLSPHIFPWPLANK